MTAEKCPECGTWWRGFEHRCPPAVTTNTSKVEWVTACPQCLHPEHGHNNCGDQRCAGCPQVNALNV